MINKNFVFYRAYNPIFTFKLPIMLENTDPFLFENTSSYIYSEYISTLNFTSLYKDRIYPEINNVSIVLGSNYFVSESIVTLDNSIDLQTNRSLLQQNYDYFILEYQSSITGSESGSNIIQLNTNYYVSESISTGSTILLEKSVSFYLEDLSEFLLE
jgi:hypothetical protein